MRECSPPPTCHVSHVTFHMSHVTYHYICFFFFQKIGETSWWRVCFNRATPFSFYGTCNTIHLSGCHSKGHPPSADLRYGAEYSISPSTLIFAAIFYLFLDKSRNLSKIGSVLLSASVERVFVAHMQDFLYAI